MKSVDPTPVVSRYPEAGSTEIDPLRLVRSCLRAKPGGQFQNEYLIEPGGTESQFQSHQFQKDLQPPRQIDAKPFDSSASFDDGEDHPSYPIIVPHSCHHASPVFPLKPLEYIWSLILHSEWSCSKTFSHAAVAPTLEAPSIVESPDSHVWTHKVRRADFEERIQRTLKEKSGRKGLGTKSIVSRK